MKMFLNFLLFVLVGVLSTAEPVMADQLHFENGDVITGKMIRMESQKLVFKTDYAGEIKVDWKKIVKLVAEDSIRVVLKDGSILEGFTGETVQNNTTLKAEKIETSSRFNLTEVKAINPIVKPAVKITARANVGINQERGNTDTDNTHIDGEFKARTKKNRFIVGGELNNEKESGITSSDNWKVYGKYNRFVTKQWSFYTFALFENDKFTDLDLRSTLGAGPEYQFFESDELNLFVGAGPGYVNEDFIVAEDKEFVAAQWVISYDQYFFDSIFQLFHNQNGYMQVDETNNWLIKTRQGIRFPIYKGFTTTFQYDYDYDNQPSEDAEKKWDAKLMFLLGYEFKN
jgi:putative salt-induced outer membrane protein YdiY